MFNDLDSTWDAVIVGGGLAGAVSGMLLARRGWHVLILDKGAPGRDKCCGHCLNPRLGPLLDELGLRATIEHVSVGRTLGLRLLMARLSPIELSFQSGAGWLTPRTQLDQALLHEAQQAGASALYCASARLLDHGAHGGRVAIRHHEETRHVIAGLVIGADGLNSAIARAAGLSRPLRRRKYGFSFTGLAPADELAPPGWVTMHIGPAGYLGVAPLGNDQSHFAALVQAPRATKPSTPAAFLDELAQCFTGARIPRLPDHASFLGAGPMPWRPHRRTAPGVALVGDAAGYIEPFTGEGIAWAMESAAILDRALANERRGHFSAERALQYEQLWRQSFSRAQRRCAIIARALEHPSLLAAAQRAGGVTMAIERRLTRAITRTEVAA